MTVEFSFILNVIIVQFNELLSCKRVLIRCAMDKDKNLL